MQTLAPEEDNLITKPQNIKKLKNKEFMKYYHLFMNISVTKVSKAIQS